MFTAFPSLLNWGQSATVNSLFPRLDLLGHMSNKTIHIKPQPNHIAFPSLSPIPIFARFHYLKGGPTFQVPTIARSTKVK